MSFFPNLKLKETWENDKGSLPLALLTAAIVLVISISMVGAVAWQASSVTNEQGIQDAKWASTSAINLGLDALANISPPINQAPTITFATLPKSDNILPLTTDASNAPTGLKWRNTPQDGVQLRWWVQSVNPANSSIIILHGEGRAGKVTPALDSIAVHMQYDHARAIWVATAITSIR